MSDLTKIMMVEDDPQVCESFRMEVLKQPKLTIVYETGSEQQAFKYLVKNDVDVIILDIELSEGDGVTLLDTIEKYKMEKPFIVVVTNTASNITLTYMREHGADYVYRKTNPSFSAAKVLSIIEKIYPYQMQSEEQTGAHLAEQFNEEKADAITRKYVERELERMGFKRRHIGFGYAVKAIMMLMKNEGVPLRVTNDVYPAIAKEENTTRQGVERAIRNAIEAAFAGSRIEQMSYYYPYPYDARRGRPTNTEFLMNMVERLQM